MSAGSGVVRPDQHPDVAQRLKRALEERRAAVEAPLPAGFAGGMDETVLQALGY